MEKSPFRPIGPSPTAAMPRPLDREQLARLRREAANPYRGLRKTLYFTFAASGAIGAFVFFAKAIAGRDLAETLPNLALQLGVVALMVGLWRWEQAAERTDRDRPTPPPRS